MSFMTEKCMVLMPVVESSVPLLERGRSSARRKPVWLLKMDLSLRCGQYGSRREMGKRYLMVTSTAFVPAASNYLVRDAIFEDIFESYERRVDIWQLKDAAPFQVWKYQMRYTNALLDYLLAPSTY